MVAHNIVVLFGKGKNKMREILEIGQRASFSKTITEADAGITGDFICVYVSQEKAEKSVFGIRVAHGMLVGSLISTVLGMRLPGEGTIYLEQNLKFKRPVYYSDTVTAEVAVSGILNEDKGIYRLDTVITNQRGQTTHEGYATVKYI